MKQKNNKKALLWDLALAKKVWRGILVLSVLGIVYSVLGASFALLSKSVVDSAVAIASGETADNLIRLSLLLVGMILLQLGIQIAVSELTVRVNGKLNIECKRKLFSSLIHKETASVLRYHTGELLNRLTGDVAVVTNAISSFIPDLIHYVTRAAVSFGVLYVLDKWFALLCLIALPIVLIAARLYRKKMKDLHKRAQESDGKTRSFLQESLANLLVIKSFGSEERVTERATALQTDNYRLNLKRAHISILSNIVFFIAMTAGYYFALAWGAFRLSRGLMSFGSLTAILQLVEQLQSPFRSLSSLLPMLYGMTASTERLLELENLPEEDLSQNHFDREEAYREAEWFCAEHVTFSYDGKKVLDDVSFRLKKGDFAAVTGLSGAGKSTLLKLFLGIMEPESGEIYLLSENGEKLSLGAETRSLFAYVPQGNLILSGTIRENIAFAKENASDEEIISAAKCAEIWEEIASLPNGLDTVLGEGGIGLSEGQIQRLAIARALLYDAPVLLLDECTSALDEKTERAVLENLLAMRSKTCFTVSHKAAAKECCNVNLYVENGKVYSLDNGKDEKTCGGSKEA